MGFFLGEGLGWGGGLLDYWYGIRRVNLGLEIDVEDWSGCCCCCCYNVR